MRGMCYSFCVEFSARIIKGSGRGKGMGTPTLNLNLGDVPGDLEEGIYACKAIVDDRSYDAVMHYGPRPVHKDTNSCEVHLLSSHSLPPTAYSLTVTTIAYIRPVLNFPSEAALIAQIADDIEKSRGILDAYDASSEKADS